MVRKSGRTVGGGGVGLNRGVLVPLHEVLAMKSRGGSEADVVARLGMRGVALSHPLLDGEEVVRCPLVVEKQSRHHRLVECTVQQRLDEKGLDVLLVQRRPRPRGFEGGVEVTDGVMRAHVRDHARTTPSIPEVPWNGASECSNLRANSSRTRFPSDGKAELELSIQSAAGDVG
ncbi:hypothetical protein CYMTET_13558 [Cymbomonas tetramitiformis]|uniref:Uncharacterized protein n=1 Tax=Cymbomonas tetramitiformis TaxID=36881 RepID=A0AAE0LB98_9CHLO|nr:hypothetical protein CYMTET_13558 [Cymbomonas tetramitiformis]